MWIIYCVRWPPDRVMQQHSRALESNQSRTGRATSPTAQDWWTVIMGREEEASGEQELNLKIRKHRQKIPVTLGSIRDPRRTHSKGQKSQSLKAKQAPARWKNRAGRPVLTAAPVTGTVLWWKLSKMEKVQNNLLWVQRLLNKQADVFHNICCCFLLNVYQTILEKHHGLTWLSQHFYLGKFIFYKLF